MGHPNLSVLSLDHLAQVGDLLVPVLFLLPFHLADHLSLAILLLAFLILVVLPLVPPQPLPKLVDRLILFIPLLTYLVLVGPRLLQLDLVSLLLLGLRLLPHHSLADRLILFTHRLNHPALTVLSLPNLECLVPWFPRLLFPGHLVLALLTLVRSLLQIVEARSLPAPATPVRLPQISEAHTCRGPQVPQ